MVLDRIDALRREAPMARSGVPVGGDQESLNHCRMTVNFS